MRDETDDGDLTADFRRLIALQCSHDISVGIERNIGHTDAFQFLCQIPGKLHLPGGGWSHAGVLVTCRAERHVFQKTINDIHFISPPLRGGWLGLFTFR